MGLVISISKPRRGLPVLTISLITIVSVVVIGLLKNSNSRIEISENHVSLRNNSYVVLKVGLESDILERSASIVSNVYCLSLYNNEKWESCSGMIRVYFRKYPKLSEGEIVVIKGKLNEPEDFSEEFSYVDYLSRQGVLSVLYYPEVEKTGEYDINPFVKAIFNIRNRIINKINMYFPEPHASLLSGVLLGVKNTMPEGFFEDLRKTGTTHIIAASGYNVTIIASFLINSLKFINRRLRNIVGIVFVWVFVIMSGGSIPVVRAAIMISMALLAISFGRISNVIQSLLFSAAVMFLYDHDVYSDISFQLSFFSTAGLIFIVPIMKRFLSFIPDFLEDSITVTLSAIVSTFPITAMNFYTFSIISPVANILTLPTVGIMMMMGSIFIVIPMFMKPLLIVISTVLWVPLDYFIKVVGLLSDLPYSSIEIPNFTVVTMLLCYSILIFIVIFSRKSDYEQEI
ncbi:MAG: ComEC/Rec2 family competence protein [bacterium]